MGRSNHEGGCPRTGQKLTLDSGGASPGACDPAVELALECLKQDLEALPRTPAVVVRLMHEHLDPLIPEAYRGLFQKLPNRWGSLLERANALEFFGDDEGAASPVRARLYELADAVLGLYYMSKEARDVFKPSRFPYECLFVIQVCEMTGIPFAPGLAEEGLRFLLEFCSHCYRPAMPPTRFCPVHTPKGVGSGRDTKLHVGGEDYWSGRRLSRRFNEQCEVVMASDWEKWKASEGEAWIVFPAEGIDLWLGHMRPKIRKVLRPNLTSLSDEAWRERLLDVYLEHVKDGAQVRKRLAEYIHHYPQFMSPMLIRTEAWLIAMQSKTPHGGRRDGAGRKSLARAAT